MSHRSIPTVIRVFSTVCIVAFAVECAHARVAGELWFNAVGRVELPGRWDGQANAAFRFAEWGDRFSQRSLELGATHVLNPAWTITPGFRLGESRPASGARTIERRKSLAVEGTTTLRRVSVTLRTRLEHRDFDVREDGWRLRFRLTARFPVTAASRWKPYASAETFHDESEGLFDERRLLVGTRFVHSSDVSSDVYMGWRYRDHDSGRMESVILGLAGRVKF